MIRSKGEAGTGDVVQRHHAHAQDRRRASRRLGSMSHDELYVAAKELQAPYDLVVEVAACRQAARSCCSPPAASPPRRTPR